MNASAGDSYSARDDFVAELSDAAWAEASRHGVGGYSIEQELELWKALRPIVSAENDKQHSSSCEDFAAELAEAAYEVTLARGFRDSFLEVRLGMWKAIRRALRESRLTVRFFRSLCPRADWRQQSSRRELAVA
jgi:hypothetical protein